MDTETEQNGHQEPVEADDSDDPRRRRQYAFYAALVVMALAALFQRLQGFNPSSFWLDDTWPVVLTRHASVRHLIIGTSPSPPLFAVLLRGFTAAAGHGHWQYQIIPLIASLACIVIAGHFIRTLTQRMSLGLMAAAFVAANPTLAIFSLRVKQYSFDALIVLLILMAAFSCRRRRTLQSFVQLTAVCTIGMLLSFPSFLVSAAFLGTIALFQLVECDSRTALRKALITLVACATVVLGFFFIFILPHFSGHWSGLLTNFYAKPTLEYMRGAGAGFFWGAFPARLTWVVLFVPVGLVAMLLDKRWRAIGVALCIFYPGLFLASMLKLWPVGAGRTDIFSYPLTITAAIYAVDVLTRKYRFFAIGGAVLAFAALGVDVATVRYTYPETGARTVVERANETVRPDDALIVYPCSNWALAMYGRWPTRFVVLENPDPGFYMYPDRPRTLVINEEIDRVWYDHDPTIVRRQLVPFLGQSHRRLVYIANAAHEHVNDWIVECITSHGYAVETSETYPTAYFTVFLKTPPRPASHISLP